LDLLDPWVSLGFKEELDHKDRLDLLDNLDHKANGGQLALLVPTDQVDQAVIQDFLVLRVHWVLQDHLDQLAVLVPRVSLVRPDRMDRLDPKDSQVHQVLQDHKDHPVELVHWAQLEPRDNQVLLDHLDLLEVLGH